MSTPIAPRSIGWSAGIRFAIFSSSDAPDSLYRAITSVPTNTAEGSCLQGQPEYSRLLDVAQGSAAETEYLLILGRDLGYLSPAAFDRLTAGLPEVARMLHGRRSKVDGARSASAERERSPLLTLNSRQRGSPAVHPLVAAEPR